MSNYAAAIKPPRTLTDAEQTRLLRASGEHVGSFRDHVIFSLALDAGLREHEIVGLDVGDVLAFNASLLPGRHKLDGAAGDPGQYVRKRVQLQVFKGAARAPAGHRDEVILTDGLRLKLKRYLQQIEGRRFGKPLFMSQKKARLSTRQVRETFANWQQRAGFERHFRFHDLRHTYCTRVYRESRGDLIQVMRLARHRKVETSMIYTHASDEQLLATVGRLR